MKENQNNGCVLAQTAKGLPRLLRRLTQQMNAANSLLGADEKFLRSQIDGFCREVEFIKCGAETAVFYIERLEAALAEKGGSR